MGHSGRRFYTQLTGRQGDPAGRTIRAVETGTVDALLTLIRRWQVECRAAIAVVHNFEQVRAHFPSTLTLARTLVAWGETPSVRTDHNLAQAVVAAA